MMSCKTTSSEQDRDVLVTRADRERILRMVERLKSRGQGRFDVVDALKTHVNAAEAVSAMEVPRNVVTLNSRVRLREMGSGKRMTLTLASPLETSMFGDQLSVANPAGIALLGRSVGQIVSWKLGPRTRRFRIEEVIYQPEAAGDFHL